VAKSPASKKNIASSRPATQAAKRTPPRSPSRPPARASGGRPAGLFTWLAIGLVVVIVATLVIIKVASGGPATAGGSHAFSPVDATTFNQLTTVPATVFNSVGVTSSVAPVTPPIKLKGQPALTAKNSAGRTVPEVLYVGAEYCPYCAAQRWSTIIALSRFGTWSGLGNMASYAKDYDGNTPTFTFVRAAYKSQYVVFTGVEEYTNYIDATTNYYKVLQTPTQAEVKIIKKYDTPKYVTGLSSSDGNPIPFMSFGNKFIVSGASYSPDTLISLTRSDIATGLTDATSPVTDAIIASANYQTASICSLTNNQPSNVCTSSGVMAAKTAMKIK
jgi:hypothetical protein